MIATRTIKLYEDGLNVSTNAARGYARPSLTSVIGRELVYSRRYDANRKPARKYALYNIYNI